MYLEYFTAAGFVTGLVCLVLTIIMFTLYRKARHASYEKEKMIINQINEIEKQNKNIKNLSSLYDNAVEYDKIKTEFFSDIIHELKTPISVILGAIQLIDMKKPCASDEQAKYDKNHQIIKLNCYRLLRLANNLLDLARMDSGYLRLNPSNCNIVYLAEEITQSVVPYAQQKQITVVFDTESEEIMTAVDFEKIEKILLNLLSNAIKFTGNGGKISVNMYERGGKVFISIKDTGIGIPKEKQNEIFERFRQVGSKLSIVQEGSGIGLSLVKSFVDLHQGSIHLESEQNKGSEFIIELPIRQVEQEDKKETVLSDQHNRIIEAINIEFSDIYSIAS